MREEERVMENWTLVYRTYKTHMASRRRVQEWCRDAMMGYHRLLTVLQRTPLPGHTPECVSHAYLLSPEGEKIPLLSGAPPHPALTREQLLETLAHRPLRPAQQGRFPVDRGVFRRRLQQLHLQFPIPGDAGAVLGNIVVAVVGGKEQGLAALCQEVLGPLSEPPRTCPVNRKPLLRRLRGFATHAQADFPAIALVLTYLAHAFAEGTEGRVWTVCETFRKLQLAKHQNTGAGAVSSHA
jgi:hypothetical protein